LIPTSTILQNLLKGGYFPLYEEDEELVEDLLLSTNQLIEMSKATLKYIVNIRDAYSTIMSHELNRVMKILTSLTIILTIPTMIASFYGMNVALPWATSPLAFVGIILFTLVVSVLLLVLFIKNRWL
ncbi:magnesium transporter CorA family protein, partial [Candidatus Parcubacteria bacterium]